MKKIDYFVFTLITLIFSYLFSGPLSYILYYQEQHHLFLFSNANLSKHLIVQGGLLSYMTDFIIQFFYFPLPGSILFASLISLIYLINSFLCKHITGKADLLQLSLLPAFYFLICYESIEFPVSWVVGVLLGLLAIRAIVSIPFRYARWLSAVLLLAVLIYSAGPLIVLITLLIVAIPCFFARFVTHRITNDKTILLFSLPVLLLYAGVAFYCFVHSYSTRERQMIEAGKCVKEKDWNGVLAISARYHGTNQLLSYFTNMALYHKGRMPYDLFKYPQPAGVESLYFPWKSDSRQSEYGHFIYEELGYLNEAHRWAFEAMVVFGETAPNLTNLIRYNIANNRPLVAQRFINILKQSLFYKKEAIAYERMLSSGKVPGLKALSHQEGKPARFANVMNLGPELHYLCERDSSDRMAFEYLMSDLLLSNQVVRFAENLGRIRAFPYPALPTLYEEALYIYKLGVEEKTFNSLGFTVSKQTEIRFNAYYKLLKSGNMQLLKDQFGDTYWYYLNFTSPYGSKIINK